MIRSAPNVGYRGDRKNRWRREVWNAFTRYSRGSGEVVLMPSIEGDEIEMAKDKGFVTSRMHIIDKNPAIVATLKRRYANINTYGVTVGRAFTDRINVEIQCANLDFCGCLGKPLLDELEQVYTSNVWGEQSCVAVTMLRGRESCGVFGVLGYKTSATEPFQKQLMNQAPIQHEADWSILTPVDRNRLEMVGVWLGAKMIVRAGTYLSTNNNHTMLWAVFSLRSSAERIARDASRDYMVKLYRLHMDDAKLHDDNYYDEHLALINQEYGRDL